MSGSPQAPGHAEHSATAEILALEGELEREGREAAIALERVQQQLEDLEAAEPSGPVVSITSDTAEVELGVAPDREEALRQPLTRTEAPRDAAQPQAYAELQRRAQELLAERDEAVGSLREALASLERLEAAERERGDNAIVEAELKSNQAEAKMREAEDTLADAEIRARSLTAAWLRNQVDSIRRDAVRAANEGISSADPEAVVEKAVAEKPAAAAPAGDAIDINTATFEQLRALGMSVTQSTRVIAYRERVGAFAAVDELDAVPGFDPAFRSEMKAKLTA